MQITYRSTLNEVCDKWCATGAIREARRWDITTICAVKLSRLIAKLLRLCAKRLSCTLAEINDWMKSPTFCLPMAYIPKKVWCAVRKQPATSLIRAHAWLVCWQIRFIMDIFAIQEKYTRANTKALSQNSYLTKCKRFWSGAASQLEKPTTLCRFADWYIARVA